MLVFAFCDVSLCSLVVSCWERADLLAPLFVTFSFAFVTFLYGVLGQVWYFIVSIPDLCILSYFLIKNLNLAHDVHVLKKH